MEESAAKRESDSQSYSNDEAMIAAANIMPRNEREESSHQTQSVVYHTVSVIFLLLNNNQ